MKLYLSSYRIPTPQDLFELVGKKPSDIKVAVIPNAKDYYAKLAWNYKVNDFTTCLTALDLKYEVVNLKDYSDSGTLFEKLKNFNIVWAIGGNTFCLRYEMKRSGFDKIINKLLGQGVVYGGDSAGALVAGNSLKGVELADTPEFAEKQIYEGLNLVPYFILPHTDIPDFKEATEEIRKIYKNNGSIIELKDSQAVIFINNKHKIVEKRDIRL